MIHPTSVIHRLRWASWVLALAVSAGFAGCGPDEEAGRRTLDALPSADARPELEFAFTADTAPTTPSALGDLAVDREGFTYVLDPVDRRIHVFDSAGSQVEIAEADEGDLPLEHPVSVDLLGDEVVVFDEGGPRLVFFRREDGRLRRTGDAPLEIFARRMCVLADAIFLLGYHEGRMLHEVDRDGRLVRSFGDPFFREPEVLARGITSGILACAPGEDPILVVAEERFARVRGYSVEGVVRWGYEPEDFRAVQVAVTPDSAGLVFTDPADGPPHRWVSLNTLGDHVVVQRGAVVPEMRSRLQITRVQTHVLDRETGTELARATDRVRADAIVGGRWAFQRAPAAGGAVIRRFRLVQTP